MEPVSPLPPLIVIAKFSPEATSVTHDVVTYVQSEMYAKGKGATVPSDGQAREKLVDIVLLYYS